VVSLAGQIVYWFVVAVAAVLARLFLRVNGRSNGAAWLAAAAVWVLGTLVWVTLDFL
jgi:hypothetical protein